jgi:hypothetical protein
MDIKIIILMLMYVFVDGCGLFYWCGWFGVLGLDFYGFHDCIVVYF